MSDQNPGTTAPATSPTGVFAELVGEGKKFRDAEALAVGKKESDNFVDVLKGENKELREVVVDLAAKVEKLTEKASFMSKISSPSGNGQENNQPPSQPTTTQTNQTVAGMTAEDVLKLVEQREVNTRKAGNLQAVEATLVNQFGAEAKGFLTLKAQELGLSIEELLQTAQRSPNAFYQLVGIQTTNGTRNASLTAHMQTTTKGGTPPGPEVRNQAWYDKKKKEMGSWKYVSDTALQVQRAKDMRLLGDRFFEN